MAITCSWEKPLGTCYSKYDENREHPITIWSGGNCLAIFTQGKQKNLECFYIDKEHMKRCTSTITNYVDYQLSYEYFKQCKIFIEILSKNKIEFTVKSKIEM